MKKFKQFAAVYAVLILLAGAPVFAEEVISMPVISMQQLDIPDTEALAFTRALKTGWNLGNTFDAADCDWLSDPLDYETAWAGVRTAPELFETLRKAGFASVRIPVSWHNHVNDAYIIDSGWLTRVKEVVGYALDAGLYVILNTHHDINEEYIYPTAEHLENSKQFLTAVWAQLAEEFRSVGEQLIFESLNEPRLKGTSIEWWLNPGDSRSGEAVQCINSLNQAFVDTIRASGGENATRYLLVPGYGASLDGAMHAAFVLPADTAENRIIVSVHAYTPYAFALQNPSESGSRSTFSAASREDQKDIDWQMDSLYKKYISNGIPVIIGEYGARNKNGNLLSRTEFFAYYIAAASARGIPCFVWDNNEFDGSGEQFGLLNRSTNTFTYPEILQSIMTYAP